MHENTDDTRDDDINGAGSYETLSMNIEKEKFIKHK
jgi:hypothetical protein